MQMASFSVIQVCHETLQFDEQVAACQQHLDKLNFDGRVEDNLGARRGRFSFARGKSLETPFILWNTKSGAVPHLTAEMFDRALAGAGRNAALYIPFEHFLEVVSSRSKLASETELKRDLCGKRRRINPAVDFRKFLGCDEEQLLFVGSRDTHRLSTMEAFLSDNDSFNRFQLASGSPNYASCITNTGNVVKLLPEQYLKDCREYLQPDVLVCLGDIFHQKPQSQVINVSKRIRKSVEHSCELLSRMDSASSGLPLSAPCLGLDDPQGRLYAARRVGERSSTVCSAFIPLAKLLNSDCNTSNLILVPRPLDVVSKLSLTISQLDKNQLRIVSCISSLEEMALSLALGADAVTTEFLDDLASVGKSISLLWQPVGPVDASWVPLCFDQSVSRFQMYYKLVDLSLQEYFNDCLTLDEGCDCPVCLSGYSRAYVHHLFATKEMLCQVLLMQHNASRVNYFLQKFKESLFRVSES